MATEEIPAKIKPPKIIELRESLVDKKRIGSFSLVPIKKNTEFGPYEGRIVYDKNDESLDPKFSWEVFDLKTFKYLHTVDATNPEHGNWMRYVCCARYFEEQNIVSTQNGCEVYYRALKDIEAGEELLTWFQPKKKKRKKSLVRNLSDPAEPDVGSSSLQETSDLSKHPLQSPDKQKRKRKPKVIPDAYDGPLDWSENEPPPKKIKEDVFEPLQPGQKRRRRKKLSTDNVDSEVSSRATSPTSDKQSNNPDEETVKPDLIKIEEDKVVAKQKGEAKRTPQKNKKSFLDVSNVRRNLYSSTIEMKKENGPPMSIAEINNSVEWEFPKSGEEYNFVLKKRHIVSDVGKKLYKCDICLGLYKHMFSLKRHYLRNHINYKYLSKSDMTNCLINLAQVKHLMRNKFPDTKEKPDIQESNQLDESNTSDKQNADDDCDGIVKNEIEENTNDSDENVEKINLNDESSPKRVHDKSVPDTSVDLKEDMNEVKNDSHEEIKEETMESLDESSPNNVCNIDQQNKIDDKKNENFCKKLEIDESNNDGTEDKNDDTEDKNDENKNEEDKNDDTQENNVNDTIEAERKVVPMPGLFRCYTCYLTFDDFITIREHTQNHPEQIDGACYPCDMCSMRFNYKHNLVRHRKTHNTEGIKAVDGDALSKKSENQSPHKHLLPSKNSSSPEKKPLLLPTVFRCGVCPQKFDSQANVVKHVKEEHKTGSKFQCSYCGKEFLSMPNMKKHVRFHLGYRATCRICSEAFSNVGALRKHTRVSHPDIYKAKLIERLEKYGVLKGPDKNALSKEIVDKVNLNRKKSQESQEVESVEIDKKEVKVETKNCKKEESQEEVDNEINFTADEIDDGGSRFKFACTVCKKRFSSYINMCRHRRKIHSNENRHRTEQCLTFGRKPRNNPSPILENPVEVAAFYANISHNIATNLNCYIDGKVESLQTFADHVKIENYDGNFGYNVGNEQPNDLSWENYNFPQDFKPVQTVSFADIKNVLNIHNDFDSHCMSVDDRGSDCENNLKRSEQKEKQGEDNSVSKHKSDSIGDKNIVKHKHLTETRNDQGNCDSNYQGIEESVEDSEVREINSDKCEKEKRFDKTCDTSEEGDTMGKSSHGLKALANLGSVWLKRGAGDGKSDMKNAEFGAVGILPIGTSIYTDSPAAKTFHQVKLGEYANFQDDLMPFDMDCPVTKATQNNKTNSEQCYLFTDEEKKHVVQTAEKFNKSAQDQLEALYDSIDNCEPVPNTIKSPKSLSELCENTLGLCHTSKKRERETSLNVEVANKLKLSTNIQKDQYGQTTMEDGPNYADEPEESPFYNYESIMFGKNGDIVQICGVCKRHFSDIDGLLRHHTKKHPAVQCSFLQVEQGYEIEDLHFSEPSTVGALAVTDPGLDNVSDMDLFRCTNCAAVFKTVSKLHVHMVNCSSIDPIFGIQKMESQSRTPLKKKLQKKIFSLFGNKTDATNELNSLTFKLTQQRNESQSPKRVFTGCRKRTSFILPDSPQKLVSEQKPLIPTSSGYNPQNHVRRRELTEILDTLTCEACGLKFKTIILLERHVKYCSKKEKFKSIQPMACPLIDESLEKIKNMCLYCNKNFTYTKSLVNHFQDFCPVKRAKLDKGELTEQDKMKEAEIIERIQKGEEVKAVKPKEIESRPKRNMPWQVGRKSKRKGHSWTNIKKRNQQKQSIGGAEVVEESDDNEGYESSESESGMEGNKLTAAPDVDDTDSEVKEPLVDTTSNVSDSDKIVDSETCDIVRNEAKAREGNGEQFLKGLSDKDKVSNYNPVVSTPCNKILDENSHLAVPVIKDVVPACAIPTALAVVQDVIQPPDITPPVAVLQDCLSPIGNTSFNSTDSSFAEKDGPLTLYTCIDVNNTSLNCTARYSVNLVNPVKKYRPIAPKPKSSSSMFHCVSKLIPTSKPVSSEKALGIDNIATYENGSNFKSSSVEIKEEAKFKMAEQGLITGKRKRARVGRVEEFLRNAFKRKKNKLERRLTTGEKESSLTLVDHQLKSASDCLEKSKLVDTDTMKLSIGDASYLKSKQAEENTLNKISQVVLSKKKHLGDKLTEESAETSVQMHKSMSNSCIDVYHNEEQHIQNEYQFYSDKGKLDNESSSINTNQKRGRGRPKGSGMKKPAYKLKPLPGRKRGRPRKFSLPETSTIDNKLKCTSDPLVSETCEISVDKGIDTTTELDNFAESDSGVENNAQHSENEKVSTYDVVAVNKNAHDLQGDTKESLMKSGESFTGNAEEEIDGYPVNGNVLNICSDGEKRNEVNNSTIKETESNEMIGHTTSNESMEQGGNIVCDQTNGKSTVHKSVSVTNNVKDEHHKKVLNKEVDEKENPVKLKQFEITDKYNTKKTCPSDHVINCKFDNYDEVDGGYIEDTDCMINRQNNVTYDDKVTCDDLSSNICNKGDESDLTNYTSVKFIAEQIAEKSSEKMAYCVVPSKDEQETVDRDTFGKAHAGTNSLDNEQIFLYDHVGHNIECEQKCPKEISCKESDKQDVKDQNTEKEIDTEDNTSDNDCAKDFIPESETNAASELDVLLEPVLSPGERVKMNKRSCKKDVDLSSPVWVKRTKLHKGKSEKKLDDPIIESETNRKTQHKAQRTDDSAVVDNKCMKIVGKSDDSSLDIGRKRKVAELDDEIAPKLKHFKQDGVKGSVKTNIRFKK